MSVHPPRSLATRTTTSSLYPDFVPPGLHYHPGHRNAYPKRRPRQRHGAVLGVDFTSKASNRELSHTLQSKEQHARTARYRDKS